jgi:hypothetical protein
MCYQEKMNFPKYLALFMLLSFAAIPAAETAEAAEKLGTFSLY